MDAETCLVELCRSFLGGERRKRDVSCESGLSLCAIHLSRTSRLMKKESSADRYGSESDDALLERIRGRDEAAMDMFFKRHSKLVYSVALRMLRDTQLAEDILQDIFMQLWQKPIVFASQQESASAYLAVLTRNRSIDRLRTQKKSVDVDSVQLASSFNLVEESEQRLLIGRVRVQMVDLPNEQRRALEMAFFDGLTHTEIAEQTGVPLGTVKTRIRTALQRLGKGTGA